MRSLIGLLSFASTFLGGLFLFRPYPAAMQTHDIVQHVHLSSVDAGHAVVDPAPGNVLHVSMTNIRTRFGYAYQVENLDTEHAMQYGGSFYCAHLIQHHGSSAGFFNGSQDGTTCGDHALAAFGGTLDYQEPSGHYAPLSFTFAQWGPQSLDGQAALFKRHRPGEGHELDYLPFFEETMDYADANGVPAPAWQVAEDWFPESSIDFDLVYAVPE